MFYRHLFKFAAAKTIMKPHHALVGAIAILAIIIFIGTVFYHYEEKWSYVDSLYFSAVTLTTIGSSELYPTNDMSKLFSVLYVLVGVPIALFILIDLIGKVAEGRLLKLGKLICDKCGREIRPHKRK